MTHLKDTQGLKELLRTHTLGEINRECDFVAVIANASDVADGVFTRVGGGAILHEKTRAIAFVHGSACAVAGIRSSETSTSYAVAMLRSVAALLERVIEEVMRDVHAMDVIGRDRALMASRQLRKAQDACHNEVYTIQSAVVDYKR